MAPSLCTPNNSTRTCSPVNSSINGTIGIINGLIDGTAAGVYRITGRAMRLQTGYIYTYAFAMLVGLALLITYIMFMGGVR